MVLTSVPVPKNHWWAVTLCVYVGMCLQRSAPEERLDCAAALPYMRRRLERPCCRTSRNRAGGRPKPASWRRTHQWNKTDDFGRSGWNNPPGLERDPTKEQALHSSAGSCSPTPLEVSCAASRVWEALRPETWSDLTKEHKKAWLAIAEWLFSETVFWTLLKKHMLLL